VASGRICGWMANRAGLLASKQPTRTCLIRWPSGPAVLVGCNSLRLSALMDLYIHSLYVIYTQFCRRTSFFHRSARWSAPCQIWLPPSPSPSAAVLPRRAPLHRSLLPLLLQGWGLLHHRWQAGASTHAVAAAATPIAMVAPLTAGALAMATATYC
jgi:hypothetical protein